ncbi:hypothetical protein [Marinobacter oulmenensis]|uniref:Uncharacterized protein n=1 Tax=Marinobacter oulmenensis TaxID=643747 RepID=A0A840UKC7_9GAMM|nr:hypothetical protein [Marinobacter oulmenensis]MBB5321556.1 hypothetical protein [Marinobacter oulmenensis]
MEHFAIGQTLGCHYLKDETKPSDDPVNSPKHLWGYTDDHWWMTALPQQFNRFRNSEPGLNLYLVLNDSGTASFHIYDRQSGWVPLETFLDIQHQPLSQERAERLWLKRDYGLLVAKQSEQMGMDVKRTSQRLGEINLSHHRDGNRYRYNDQLGLVKASNDQWV